MEREEDIIQLIKRVKEGSEKVGMGGGGQVHIFVDGEDISTVTSCKFLWSLITSDGCNREEKEKNKFGQNSNVKIDKNYEGLGSFNQHKSSACADNCISSNTLYICEGWTLRKANKRKIDAFELWTWRSLHRIPWSASNQIRPKHSLEALATINKLKYFGHSAHIRFHGKRFNVRTYRQQWKKS